MPTPLRTTYWNQLHQHLAPEQAPWYQPRATASLELLARTALPFDAPILDVGSGHSPFLTKLLDQGYFNLIATDCSVTALDQHRRGLAPAQAEQVLWVVDDLIDPHFLPALNPVLLWHDRGVLHGLLSPAEPADYMLAAHGWALLGVRLPAEQPLSEGGLLIQPYDAAGLGALLGESYALRHTVEELHVTPEGETQPYLYALFQRNGTSREGAWPKP
jgi:hypothetical protein